jgi:hypothetical protein
MLKKTREKERKKEREEERNETGTNDWHSHRDLEGK